MKFDSPRVELGALQWLKVCRLRFATTLDKSEDEPRTQQFNDNPRHARGSYATYYNDSEAARGFLDAFGASGESADHFRVGNLRNGVMNKKPTCPTFV